MDTKVFMDTLRNNSIDAGYWDREEAIEGSIDRADNYLDHLRIAVKNMWNSKYFDLALTDLATEILALCSIKGITLEQILTNYR